MIIDGVRVNHLDAENFSGLYKGCSIQVSRHISGALDIEIYQCSMIGPEHFFLASIGNKQTHITEAITFAKEKINQ